MMTRWTSPFWGWRRRYIVGGTFVCPRGPAYPSDDPPSLSRTAGTGSEIRLTAKIDFARKTMSIGLAVLWGGFTAWGMATLAVRHLQVRACRERQAKNLALALAELDRRRQLDKAA
jgi:hypothetical protein